MTILGIDFSHEFPWEIWSWIWVMEECVRDNCWLVTANKLGYPTNLHSPTMPLGPWSTFEGAFLMILSMSSDAFTGKSLTIDVQVQCILLIRDTFLPWNFQHLWNSSMTEIRKRTLVRFVLGLHNGNIFCSSSSGPFYIIVYQAWTQIDLNSKSVESMDKQSWRFNQCDEGFRPICQHKSLYS